MTDIWQEHRKFIVTLVAGVLVFIIAYAIVDGIYSGDIRDARRTIAAAKSAKRRQAVPPGVDLGEERARLEERRQEFLAAMRAIDREPAEGFAVGGDVAEADLHFSQQVASVRGSTVELCARKNISVDPGLGLPDSLPTSRSAKDWYLRGLDVVNQMLALVLDADQELEGGIVRVEEIRIAPPRGKPEPGAETLFELLPVSLKIVGHPQAVDVVLRSLPRKGTDGRYVALVQGAIRSLDVPPDLRRRRGRRGAVDPGDEDRVEVQLEVAAVFIRDAVLDVLGVRGA